MATYWEIAADLANDMFSKYFFQFSFSQLQVFFFIAPLSDHCLLVPLSNSKVKLFENLLKNVHFVLVNFIREQKRQQCSLYNC